jgi:hypothetical protein
MSTDNIMNLGNDQLASQFDLTIHGVPTGGDSENVTLRADMTFQVPEDIVGTYDIYKKGIKITKTSMLTDTDKKFTIEWRVDQDWKTFDVMKKWFDAVYSPITGTALPDSMVRTNVSCQAVDTQNAVKKVIRFKNAKPVSWQLTAFENNSTDPLRCTMNFIYVDMIIENI